MKTSKKTSKKLGLTSRQAPLLAPAAVVLSTFCLGSAAQADVTWNGSTSTDWAVTANWSGAPNNQIVRFNSTFTNQPMLTAAASIAGIYLPSGLGQDVTIGADTPQVLTIGNNNFTSDDPANHSVTFGSNVQVKMGNATNVFVQGAGASAFVLNGGLTGVAGSRMIMLTPGSVTLGGTSALSEVRVQVARGALNLKSADSLNGAYLNWRMGTLDNTSGGPLTVTLGSISASYDGVPAGIAFWFDKDANAPGYLKFGGSNDLTIDGTGRFGDNIGVPHAIVLGGTNRTLAFAKTYEVASTAHTMRIEGAGNTLSMGGLFGRSTGATTSTLYGTSNVKFTGPIVNGSSSSLGLYYRGSGTVTLTGSVASTYTGSTTVDSGAMVLDFASAGAPAVDMVNNTSNSSALGLGGGTVVLQGGSTVANSQRFNGLYLSTGASSIKLVTNATTAQDLSLNVGNIVRYAGGAIDFTLPSGTQTVTNGVLTGKANDSTGIIGAYATVNGGANFATVSGSLVAPYTGSLVYGATKTSVFQAVDVGTDNLLIDATSASDILVDTDQLPATDINTLQITDSAARTVAFTPGAVLRLGSTGAILLSPGAGALQIDVPGGAGVLTAGGATTNAAGELILNNSSANSFTVNAPIINNGTGTVSVTKSGTGTVTLTAANTYTGTTNVGAGVLKLTATNNILSTNTVNTYGTGTLDINGLSQILGQVTNNGTITNSDAGTTRQVTITKGLDGWGNFTGKMDVNIAQSTSGDYTYNGAVNTIGKIINSGTGIGSITLNGPVASTVTEIIQDSSATALKMDHGMFPSAFSGPISVKSGTAILLAGNLGSAVTSGSLILGDTTPGNSKNASLLYAEAAKVAYPIYVMPGSSGTLTIGNLPGQNQRADINTLIVLNNNLTIANFATGNGSVTVNPNGGTSLTGTGNVVMLNNSGGGGTGGQLQIQGNGTNPVNNLGTITHKGTATVPNYDLITGQIGPKVTEIIQDCAGTGLKLYAWNNSQTFVGRATVLTGTLAVENGNLGSANAVAVGTNGILDINGSVTIAGLNDISGAGGYVQDSKANNTGILTLGGTGNYSFSGNIRHTGTGTTTQALTVALTGSGSQALSGSNDYTGATLVKSGKLIVKGSIAGSAVTVGNSAALTTAAVLMGTGTTGNLTLGAAAGNTGAVLDPGTAAGLTGALTVGSFTTTDGVHLGIQLAGTTPGLGTNGNGTNGYDQLITTGAVTLGSNFILDLSVAQSFPDIADGTKFFILLNGSVSAISGTFNGYAQDSEITIAGGYRFRISYTDNGDAGSLANDISLTAVPEPSTWAMVLGGLGMLIWGNRLSRKRSEGRV